MLLALIVTGSGCSSHKPLNTLGSSPRDYLFPNKKHRLAYIEAYDKTLSLFDTPVEELDIETRFGKAHVLASGPKDAQPLILLHGLDASSTMWYPNMAAYSKTHRVYAIDYIMDAGKSSLRAPTLSKAQIVLFYNDVFDKLKLSSIDVLGTSRGGWIAAWLAIQPENRVRKLVLMSPAQVFSNVNIKIFPAITFKLFPSQKTLSRALGALAKYPDKIAPEYRRQFYIASRYGKSRAQITKMTTFSNRELQKLKMPVLFLLGDSDVINGKKAMERARKNLPDLQIEMIADSGHFLSTDQTEIVNQKVTDFLH